MVYFVNICEGTGIRKIVTNILRIFLHWTGYVTDLFYKVLFLQRKAMRLRELFWPAGEKRKKKNGIMTISKKCVPYPKSDVWPNVILAGFVYHLVHHLGSVTKTNKPALGRVGRIRVEKTMKTKLKLSLNYLRIKVNDQNIWDSSRPVCFYEKFLESILQECFLSCRMASNKEVSVTQQALGDSWSANLPASAQPWCVWVQTTASGTTSPSLRSVCGFFYVPLPVSRMKMKATRPAA